MKSNNGDLYFEAGIDLDSFNAGADAMEQRMRGVTSAIVSDAGKMDDALSAVGSAFTRIAGAGAAGAFVKQMFNVRSEMQNTEAMLRVFLGSAEKANDFFKSLQGYAYNNVFEFSDLAKQSAQLLAYKTNVEDVIPTLNKLSEIAAGTNAPLENLVSTFNKVKANNKLDSYAIYSLGNMGIDVYQTLADIKSLETGTLVLRDAVKGTSLEFKDLQKVIDYVTTNGGMYEGMMVEKMKTLGDSMGLMQDNITNMFNEIGAQTQGLMKGGMDVANFLIENYEEIAKVLATLVVSYGAVKAANIAMSLAQKNGTGVAVMDNTVRAIQAKLLKEEIKGRTDVKKSIEEQRKKQQEEIETLRAAITEREHSEMVDKARIAALDNILSQSQKAQLEQMGLNSTMSEYLPVAVDMLDKQQSIAFQQSELTNNNQAYIESMRELLGINADETVSIEERINAAQELLATAEEEANSTADAVEQARNKVEVMQDYYEQSLQNINATDLQERQEALETATAELETAQKNAETAAETRNTAQRRLNELQTKRQATANTAEATTTSVAAKAKLLLSRGVKMVTLSFKQLWATLMANPLGLIIAGITALISGIRWLVNRNKEAKEAQKEHNTEIAKFNTEVDKETTRVNNLVSTIKHSTKGTAAYTKSMQELNKICKEYNVTAFNAIEPIERQREAYEALTAAIKAKVAAKILEKAQEQAQADKEERDTDLITETIEMMSKKQNVGKGVVRDFFRDEEYARQRDLFMTAMQGEAAVVAAGMEKGDEAVKKLIKTFEEFTGSTIAGKAKLTLETMFASFVFSAKQANEEVSEASKIAETYTHKEEKTNEVTATGAQRIKELTERLVKLKKEREEILKLDLTEAELKERLNAKDDEIKAVNNDLKLLNGGTTSTTSGNDVSKKRREYAEQQAKDAAMLQYDIEDARIQAMEVGSERQLTQMRNDFNRKLAELSYERKEIDKKRKELGLSSIDWNETDKDKMGSEQRRMKQKQDALIQSYNEQMKSVYSGEVDRMKALYEQYDRWVETLGQEAADKRFKNLLPKGEDYGAWLANAIVDTQEQLDTIGDDDPKREALLQYLFQLQEASNELFGVESKMNKFLRELNENLEDAGGEAEKLAILNKEMERLQNADPSLGLTETQITALIVQLRQQIRQTEEGMEKAFTEKYLSFVANRAAKAKQYEDEIKKLRDVGSGELADAAEQELQEELKSMDTDFVKQFLGKVFDGDATKKALKAAYSKLSKMQSAIMSGDTNTLNAFGLGEASQAQLDDLLIRIGEIRREIEDADESRGLSNALRNIREGLKEGDTEKIGKGIDYISDKYSKFANVVSSLASALNDLAEATDNEDLKNTAKTVGKVSNVVQSAGSMAGVGASIGGGWGALIGAVVGGGIGIIQEIANDNAERQERIVQAAEEGNEYQQEVASQLVSILGAVLNLSDTVASLNYSQYRSSLLDLIAQLQDNRDTWYKGKNGKNYWNTINSALRPYAPTHVNDLMYAEMNGYDQYASFLRNRGLEDDLWYRFAHSGLIDPQEAYERMMDVYNNSASVANWWDAFQSFGSISIGEKYWDEDAEERFQKNTTENIASYINWMAGEYAKRTDELIKELEELYKENTYDSLKYFNKEQEVYQSQLEQLNFQMKVLELLGQEDTDEYRDIVHEIANLEHEIGESLLHMAEGLYGMDIQSIISEWISIFEEFGNNVDGAFNKIDQSIDQLVANMLRKRLVVEPLMTTLSNIFDEYAKDLEEGHVYDESDFVKLAEKIKDAKGEASEAYQNYLRFLENLGIDLADITDTSTLTGSIQNLSEETGGIIAGRMNAMVINQAETTSVLRQSLLVQYEMNNHLATIEVDVAQIKRSVGQQSFSFNENMNLGRPERFR